MSINQKELAKYKSLNKYARNNSVVIFGSTFASEMPIGELKQGFGIISEIYNRSLSGLSVFEACEVASEIVYDLFPKKLVIQLGEVDLENNASTEDVIKEIGTLVKGVKKNHKSTKVVLVSLNNLTDKLVEKSFNQQLETLASELKCEYADITSASEDDISRVNTFRLLKYHMDDYLFCQIM